MLRREEDRNLARKRRLRVMRRVQTQRCRLGMCHRTLPSSDPRQLRQIHYSPSSVPASAKTTRTGRPRLVANNRSRILPIRWAQSILRGTTASPDALHSSPLPFDGDLVCLALMVERILRFRARSDDENTGRLVPFPNDSWLEFG